MRSSEKMRERNLGFVRQGDDEAEKNEEGGGQLGFFVRLDH